MFVQRMYAESRGRDVIGSVVINVHSGITVHVWDLRSPKQTN